MFFNVFYSKINVFIIYGKMHDVTSNTGWVTGNVTVAYIPDILLAGPKHICCGEGTIDGGR